MPVLPVDSRGGPATVTGTWYATIDLPGLGNLSATLSLVQTDASVSGTVAIVGFGSGSLVGNVSGETMNFVINELSPCAGTFNGTAAINEDYRSVAGSFSGSDCDAFWSATFSGAKVSSGGLPAPDTADLLEAYWPPGSFCRIAPGARGSGLLTRSGGGKTNRMSEAIA